LALVIQVQIHDLVQKDVHRSFFRSWIFLAKKDLKLTVETVPRESLARVAMKERWGGAVRLEWSD